MSVMMSIQISQVSSFLGAARLEPRVARSTRVEMIRFMVCVLRLAVLTTGHCGLCFGKDKNIF